MRSLSGARVTASLLDVLADVAADDQAGLPPAGLPTADRARRLGERLGRALAGHCQADGAPVPADTDAGAIAALIRPLLSRLLPGSRVLHAAGGQLAICLPPIDRLDAEPPARLRMVVAAIGSLAGHLAGQARTRLDLQLMNGATCQVLTVRLAPWGAAAPDEDEYRKDDVAAAGARELHPDPHQERLQQLGEMAASVAHGLNNLLGAVAGQSSQLLEAATRDTARRDACGAEPIDGLRLIHQAALDGAGLARRLLRTARGEQAEASDALDLVDLGRVLVDAVELTRSRWHDEARRRGICIEPAIEIGQPLLIRGVAADLREIVVNLVLNAIDAMPAGGRLRLCGDVQGGSVILSCQDTGVGMPPEVLARVFEPFFTTKGRDGTGMGMAILYGVVARHGGQVHISSTEGVGTTVTLRLPAAELTHGAGLTPSVGALARGADRSADAAASLARDLGPLSVLVVEDDPVFRAVFSKRLRLDAERVEAVGDALSALELLEAGSWDLVCVDEGLPDRSGRELAAEIERRGLGCAVILVTGAATRPDDPLLASAGVDAVLPKPCSDAELARAVRAAAGSQAGGLATTA